MITTEELRDELKTKERTLFDLLRFVTTRSDKIPNYNLLLGAGCSITSGIKSGGQLIETWREEIYKSYDKDNQEGNYNQEVAIEYLSKNCGSWYNKNNEYSSLFEKKYDLPRQRRMFVEQEVDGKTPSIGYAYLVNLIRSSYFNAVFTTNFDDLINDAFYQFSDIRPILCAHDSSITSITVTSKRPKIIKLHGDYLFDDIKSTLRETESLEENIRNKFIEFAKDYGLLVVGYAGNDRSIMDVLSFLLKHEDYYKNGIYWCIRKGDSISEDLRKLLWKDKVYFIIIDGFDELFAELHQKIFDDKLPIDTNFISSKSQEIIQKFLTNEFLINSNSDAIKYDLKNLSSQNERNNIFEILKQIELDKNIGSENIDNKDAVTLIQITTLIKENSLTDAALLIEDSLSKTSNKYFRVELLKRYVTANKKLKKVKEALKASDNLIELEPKNPLHLLSRFNLEDEYNEKIVWLDKAIVLDKYNSLFYRKKADYLIKEYDYTLFEKGENYTEILELLERSIELDPSIKNESHFIKFQFLLATRPGDKSDLDTIIERLSKQNPYSIDLLQSRFSVVSDPKELIRLASDINDVIELLEKEDALEHELLYLDVLSKLNDKEKIKSKLHQLDLIDFYSKKAAYIQKKAELLLKKFNKIDDAIELLKALFLNNKSRIILKDLLEYLLFSEKVEEAENYYESNKSLLSPLEKLRSEKDFYDAKKDYLSAYEKLKEIQYKSRAQDRYVSNLSYYLLKLNNNKEALDLLHEFLTKRNFDRNLEAEIINYEIARKRNGQKIDKVRLGDLKSSTNSKLVKAAICALENNIQEVFALLDEAIEADASSKYQFKDWCVFDEIRDDPKFIRLCNS